MEQHVNGEDAQNCVFEVWIFVHEDGDHAHVGQEAARTSHDVFFRQPQLPGSVKASIVHGVVVALCKELHGPVRSKTNRELVPARNFTNADLLFMEFDYSVHDWNVPTLDFEHHDLADPDGFFRVVRQE